MNEPELNSGFITDLQNEMVLIDQLNDIRRHLPDTQNLSDADFARLLNEKPLDELLGVQQTPYQIIADVKSGKVSIEPVGHDYTRQSNFGEMVMDQHFRLDDYPRISTDQVTSLDDPIRKGIDGVYHNPDGHPPFIIAEDK